MTIVEKRPVPHGFFAAADIIDRITAAVGRAAAWCTLAILLLQVGAVVLRHLFGTGFVWLHEAPIYAHAGLIMLAAAWTLAADGHIRVDIFYADAPPRRKAALDLVGALVLLIPFALALLVLSWPYVARSWALLEGSRETSGIPAVFLVKSLIPAFAALMMLQGVSQAIRAYAVLRAPRMRGTMA